MAQRGEIQCTEKSACAFAGYGEINNLRCKAVVERNVGSFNGDGTLQRERITRLPLFVFLQRQFLQPRSKHEERLSHVLDSCPPPRGLIGSARTPGAPPTRNEDKPDPCEVKLNDGQKTAWADKEAT